MGLPNATDTPAAAAAANTRRFDATKRQTHGDSHTREAANLRCA